MTTKVKRITPTLTHLNAMLAEEGIAREKPLTIDYCETYGTRTMCYFHVADMETRRRLEARLTARGVKVNPIYWTRAGGAKKDVPMLEVQVSYLRAHGWRD